MGLRPPLRERALRGLGGQGAAPCGLCAMRLLCCGPLDPRRGRGRRHLGLRPYPWDIFALMMGGGFGLLFSVARSRRGAKPLV